MASERRSLTFFEAVTDELYEENKRLRSENEVMASYFARVDSHFDEYQEVGVGLCDHIAKLTQEKDAAEAQMQRLAEQNHALQLKNQALKHQVADLQLMRSKHDNHNQVSDAVLVAVPIPMAQLKQERSSAAQVQHLQLQNRSLQQQIDQMRATREQAGHDSVKAFSSTLSRHLDAVAERRASNQETNSQTKESQMPDALAIFARQLSKQLNELASRPTLRRRSE